MLILSLRRGDVLEIGENVQIQVLRVGRGRVKVGVDAPKEVDVNRVGQGPSQKEEDHGRES